MFINAVSHYLPTEKVGNDYFEKVNGLSDEWIFSRTGIKNRTKASEQENTNTMSIEAVRELFPQSNILNDEIDLIVGATYSPYDTVGTLAHAVQREFMFKNAKVISVSSACSSLINAIEIVEGYFALNKATKAIVVAAEHNSIFNNESDERSGHLWGDGAAAMIITKNRICENDFSIEAIYTHGLGHVGKGPEAVYLQPSKEGLQMPFGKDVFSNACYYMIMSLKKVLDEKGYSINDLSYIIPHQANVRIISNIAKQLKFNTNNIFTNIEELGNTGCASTAIAFSQNISRLKKGDLVGFTVFGGGYSCGAMIVKV